MIKSNQNKCHVKEYVFGVGGGVRRPQEKDIFKSNPIHTYIHMSNVWKNEQ